jgi:hypothetical protein
MDGFNGQGNGSEFNASGSGNPTGFDLGNVFDYDDARRIRNLFSLAPSGSGSSAYNTYTYSSVPHPYSSLTPSHPGMSGLNLNASSGYPHINEYEDILRSGDQQGGVGSSRGAPPVGVPSASVGVDVAPLPHQRQRPSRARGGRRGGANNNPLVPVHLASH